MPANPTIPGQMPQFAHLSSKALNAISRAMSERSLPAGSEIVIEGQGGIGFFTITEGTVEVMQSGEPSPRTTLGAGACSGEIALLDEGPRTATIRAVTSVTSAILIRWEFRALLCGADDMGLELLEGLVRRLCALKARIADRDGPAVS